ncbi:MAG: 6-phosphogluconolactonase [Planctomycetota bacterium]
MAAAYSLEPEPDRPTLPERFVRAATAEEAVEQLAADLFVHIQNCVRAFGDCHLAMSSGASIERVCHVLMLDPQFRPLPWKRVRIWAAVDTIGSWPTSGMLDDLLVAHADVPAAQCHTPRDAVSAEAYGETLREQLGWRERGHDRIDAVVLDVEAMGLIESLGRRHGSARTAPLACEATSGSGPGPGAGPGAGAESGARSFVAINPAVVRAARLVSVSAFGGDAREAVGRERVREEADGLTMLGGSLRWYVDAASWPSESPS